MTDRLPLIRLGWLRALLFFIASFITSQIFAGIGMVVALLISGFDISTLSNQDAIIDELNKINFLLLLLKIIEFFALMFCLWLFMKFIDRKPLMSLGLKYEGFQQDFKFGLILGAGLIAIGFFSLFILGYVRVESFSFPFLDIVLYFILFVVVAFHEEIMLRGYILRSLMESMNRYLALTISSLVFMTVHLLNPNISFLGCYQSFLSRYCLGYLLHTQTKFMASYRHAFNVEFLFQGPIFWIRSKWYKI